MRLTRTNKPSRSNRLKAIARITKPKRAKKLVRVPWQMNKRAAIVLGAIGAAAVIIVAVVAGRPPAPRTDAASFDAPAQSDARPQPRADVPAARTSRAPQAEVATTGGSDRTASDSSQEPSNGEVQKAAPVTVTGCVEADDETFRLKDTEGADAPKSRSWRSGFLKKRAASIELVDASHRLELPRYVGQRVVATGMLANREMQLRSLRRVSATCS